MKRNILLYITLVIFLVGCSEEFLERPPQDAITIDNYFQTVPQINAATGFLYSMPWFNLNDKAHWSIGDVRAGNMWMADQGMAAFFTFSQTSANERLAEAWSSLWIVVAHSNAIINDLPTRAAAGIPQPVIDRAVAEALFMRATAYFYLVRIWGGVPIIENPSDLINNPIVPRNRIEDVYRMIIRDLEKAIVSLPPDPFQPGRVTEWSAKGMLAKVYLTYSGYGQNGSRRQEHLNKARDLAGDVINNSGLRLMPNFADLFKYENDNNEETLFAFQWISCLGWGTQNTNQAYFAATGITGVGDGWGANTGPTIDLQNEFEPNDLRRQPTFMIDGDFYPELHSADGGYTHEMDETVPLAAMANIKKYVIGNPDDNDGNVCFMSTGINTYVLRLADVYLIYAEAVLGNNASTSDESALEAFNAIRERAGLSSKASFTWDDIRRERRIEFAFESDYWYDLLRWWYWNPDDAIAHINNQERGQFGWNATLQQLVVNSARFPITNDQMYLQIPAADVSRNPLLLEEPVPYDFGGN